MKKLCLTLCVVLALSCALGAFTAAAEAGKVVFWLFNDWTTGDALEEFTAYANEFKEATGIEVELVGKPDSEIKSGLMVGASSGELPDAFALGLNTAYSMVQSGIIADIAPYWNQETPEYQAQFTPPIMETMKQGDTVWGLPMTGWATVLYRNLDTLEAAGIDTAEGPADWDEWLDQMQKVRDAGFDAMNDFSVDGWAVYNFLGGVDGVRNAVVDGQTSFTKGT